MSFLPEFTTVVSFIILVTHTSIIVHPQLDYKTFPQDAECPVVMWLVSCSSQVECPC